jgi:AcrR family transcriptional regulator
VEQVERNHAMVLDAARRVFLERGYAGATIDAIAEEAGFSKGVVYSQFAGKPDLFLALLEQRITERAAENAHIAATRAGLEGVRGLLSANARHTEEGGSWTLLLIEFRVVAARDPALNRRYAVLHAHTVAQFTEALRTTLGRGGLAMTTAPVCAGLVLAIAVGRVLEQAAGTVQVRDEDVLDLVARLVEPI